ncbi:MAG: hypothetical protein ACOYL6_18925 [Bacteriovoracaceae bacterium]
MRTYILITLAFICSLSIYAREGGSAGNGGDGVFCSWRNPMALDYYASGFIGGALYGNYSPIIDIYSSQKTIAELSLQILDQVLDSTHDNFKIEGIKKSDVKSIRKNLKRSLKAIGNYSRWKLVDDVAIIKDSLHDDFLPVGCKVKQIANAQGKKVTVNRNLFNQLDEKQKEVLALHEAIYLLGRENFGHNNSFLTRNLIRAILRRGADSNDQEIYSAIEKFIFNKLPKYANNIDENIPGSGILNSWRLNIFDLSGDFILEDNQDVTICDQTIKGVVTNDLHFNLSIDDFSQSKLNSITLLQFWISQGFLSSDEAKALSLGTFDRALFYENGNDFKMIGLNRKDQFFSLVPLSQGHHRCLYKRSIP